MSNIYGAAFLFIYVYFQNIYSSERLKLHTAGISTLYGFWQDRKHLTIVYNHSFPYGVLADARENLFYQMMRRLDESGELLKETVFIDGAKLKCAPISICLCGRKRLGNEKSNTPFLDDHMRNAQ